MLRSLYSGVSGLRTHQTKMDVIGNNIANVNTTAFKSSRVTFKDVYYQTISSATANTDVKGGSNAKQIGYGTTLSSIDVINTRGGIAMTDRTLDLYIAGDGYFVVKDMSGATNYTRSGNFSFDVQGALVDANGNYVAGWQPMQFDNNTQASPIIIKNISDYTNIMIGKDGKITGVYSGPAPAIEPGTYQNLGSLANITVTGYTNIRFENGVLKGDDTASGTTDVELYNNIKFNDDGTVTGDDMVNGTTSVIIANLKSFAKEPEDYAGWSILADGSITAIYQGHNTGEYERLGSINGPSLTFAGYSNVVYENGSIIGTDIATGNQTVLYTNVTLRDNGVLTGDNQLTGTAGEIISTNILSNYVYDLSIYSNLTILPDGTVAGQYISFQEPHTPDDIEVLGQIAIAKFTNPEGLSQQDGIYFQETKNSGAPNITYPGNNATGTIVSGGLEMSNVDLSKEFTDMITTQRGFQANSRIITVSDEMLQELVNLKR